MTPAVHVLDRVLTLIQNGRKPAAGSPVLVSESDLKPPHVTLRDVIPASSAKHLNLPNRASTR